MENFSEILVGEDGRFGPDDIDRLENSDYSNVLEKARLVLPSSVFEELQSGTKINLTTDQIYELDFISTQYSHERSQIVEGSCNQLSFGHIQIPSGISVPNAAWNSTTENAQNIPEKYHFLNESTLSNDSLLPYVEKILPVMQDSVRFLNDYFQSNLFETRLQELSDKNGFCGDSGSIITELTDNFQKDAVVIFRGEENLPEGTSYFRGVSHTGHNGRIVLSFHIYRFLEYPKEELMSLMIHELTHTADADTLSSLLQQEIDRAIIDNPENERKQSYSQSATEFYARLMQVRKDLSDFGVDIYQNITEQDIIDFLSMSEESSRVFYNIYMLEFNGDHNEAYEEKGEYLKDSRFQSAIRRYVNLANTLP